MSNNSKGSKLKPNEAGNKALQSNANQGRLSIRAPTKLHEAVNTWLKLANESRPLREMIIQSDDDRSDHNGQGKDSTKVNKSMIIKWLATVGQYRTLYDYDRDHAAEFLIQISDHQRSEYRLEMVRILDHFRADILTLMNIIAPDDEVLHATMMDGYLRDHFLFAPPDPHFDLIYRQACTFLSMAAERTPYPDDDI